MRLSLFLSLMLLSCGGTPTQPEKGGGGSAVVKAPARLDPAQVSVMDPKEDPDRPENQASKEVTAP